MHQEIFNFCPYEGCHRMILNIQDKKRHMKECKHGPDSSNTTPRSSKNLTIPLRSTSNRTSKTYNKIKKSQKIVPLNIDSITPDNFGRYRCPYKNCDKSLARKTGLRFHINSHQGIRPYKCDNEGCDMAFFRPSNKTAHQRKCPAGKNNRNKDISSSEPETEEEDEDEDVYIMPRKRKNDSDSDSKYSSSDSESPSLSPQGYKCPIENCGEMCTTQNALNTHLYKHGMF